MKARTREMNRKIPAHHQEILVSKVVACRPPMNCSVPAPPPSDASPPPWPARSNTAVGRIRASRVRRISRKLYMRPGKYLGSAGLHKLRPAFGIEGGAAHQDAIELAFGEEGGGVLRVHTSAVEDPRRRGASACEPAADLPVHGGGVLGGRVAAGADRPHGRSEEHTSELQSPCNLVCRLLLEKKKTTPPATYFCSSLTRPPTRGSSPSCRTPHCPARIRSLLVSRGLSVYASRFGWCLCGPRSF